MKRFNILRACLINAPQSRISSSRANGQALAAFGQFTNLIDRIALQLADGDVLILVCIGVSSAPEFELRPLVEK